MDAAAARALADAHAAHAAACSLYSRSLTGDEDAKQEAFVRLARHLTAGRGEPRNARAWLLTAVRSAALDEHRGDRRRRDREQRAVFDQADDHGDPAAVDAEAVGRALMRLPARRREAVVLRLWCGLEFNEIARLCGVAASTAHADYTAALADLRHFLEDHDDRL